MRRSHKLRLMAMLAVGATVAAAVSGLASAGQNDKGRVFNDTFHRESTETIPADPADPGFCGEQGLTVRFDVVVDGREQVVLRGRDQLPYYAVHIEETTTATNLANGRSLMTVATFIDKDLRVTDNGDDTLTATTLLTGVSKLYGENGTVIALDPGQIRIEILIDTKGTSTPTDDTVEFVGVVKESTGRSDDYCEVAVPILLAP